MFYYSILEFNMIVRADEEDYLRFNDQLTVNQTSLYIKSDKLVCTGQTKVHKILNHNIKGPTILNRNPYLNKPHSISLKYKQHTDRNSVLQRFRTEHRFSKMLS